MNKKEWFKSRRWGVFCHYLDVLQNNADKVHSGGISTDWDTCVNDFDTDAFAGQLNEMGAGYVIFTIMQGTNHMIAPNKFFNDLTGYKNGEACSSRDLIADLIKSLGRYEIPLFLYFTGDGMLRDETAKAKLPDCGVFPVTDAFVDVWAGVLECYSKAYGKDIRGWWLDGVYGGIGYNDKNLAKIHDAALAGNPDALFSANFDGCLTAGKTKILDGMTDINCKPVPPTDIITGVFYHEIVPPTAFCDYTAGEIVNFDAYPVEDYKGAVPHVLSFLGIPDIAAMVYDGWGRANSKYTGEYMKRYISNVNGLGGVVSVDMCLHRDGRFDEVQLAVMREVNKR